MKKQQAAGGGNGWDITLNDCGLWWTVWMVLVVGWFTFTRWWRHQAQANMCQSMNSSMFHAVCVLLMCSQTSANVLHRPWHWCQLCPGLGSSGSEDQDPGDRDLVALDTCADLDQALAGTWTGGSRNINKIYNTLSLMQNVVAMNQPHQISQKQWKIPVIVIKQAEIKEVIQKKLKHTGVLWPHDWCSAISNTLCCAKNIFKYLQMIFLQKTVRWWWWVRLSSHSIRHSAVVSVVLLHSWVPPSCCQSMTLFGHRFEGEQPVSCVAGWDWLNTCHPAIMMAHWLQNILENMNLQQFVQQLCGAGTTTCLGMLCWGNYQEHIAGTYGLLHPFLSSWCQVIFNFNLLFYFLKCFLWHSSSSNTFIIRTWIDTKALKCTFLPLLMEMIYKFLTGVLFHSKSGAAMLS